MRQNITPYGVGKAPCKRSLFVRFKRDIKERAKRLCSQGVGKAAALKKFENILHFKRQANVLSCHSAVSGIVTAGEKALVSLFGGKPGVGLNALRHQRYFEKLLRKTPHIEPQNLPSTAVAVRFHSLRIYLQVKQWQEEAASMSMEDWGWKVSNYQVLPVATDLPPTSESLLQIIRCNCSFDCSSMRCICRKNGMQCSLACGQCKGDSCANSSNTVDYESEDSEG